MGDLNFKFFEFKEYILNSTSEVLKEEGFKLNKSKLSFSRKVNSSKIEIAFDFLNYYPDSYEYNFSMIIWVKEIAEITSNFFQYAGINEPVKWSTLFFEADFDPSLRNKEFKFRSGSYKLVSSFSDLQTSLPNTLEKIRNEALPLGYALCSFKNFQEYYLNNKEEVVKNFASNDLFISSLLAANIKGKREFEELSEYLRHELDKEKAQGSDYKQLYFYLDRVRDYTNTISNQ